MLRADSLLGRLVLALAASPPEEQPVPHERPGARLVAALGARALPATTVPPQARFPHRPWAHLPASRGRRLPGLLTAWLVALACLTAAAVQEVLPTPWQQVAPEEAGALPGEHWWLVSGGRLGSDGRAVALTFTPDGRSLVTVGRSATQTWDVVDPERPKRVVVPRGMPQVTAVGTSPDGRTLVAAGPREVRALSLASGATRWSAAGIAGTVKALTVTGHGVLLAGAAPDGGTEVTALGTATGKARRLSRLGTAARSARFSPDGRTLAVAGSGGPVRLWDVSDPARPRARAPLAPSSSRETTALAFSPDARLLATVEAGGSVRLWDVADPARPRPLGRPFAGDTGRVAALAFSPDGRLVATVGADGTANLWWRSAAEVSAAPDVLSGATAQ
ncbi:WD40 repeat domain-containing protein [Streptomyces naphthomycinicus]|uniref:WD40 repeat domain-containing protein n=1 Tax=Streptomyces naphthomycinicus TaxID=2872625 RepID=UPI001CED7A78|nr:hypothetical protein [Streptomyces sp. TML10]